MREARLITIPFSHYCEKARWALDATGIPYVEEPHAPVAHMRATRAVGGKTVPVLVHGGRILCDSTDIAHHADALALPDRRILPTDAAERAKVIALEDELDETIGIDARRIVYWHSLHEPEAARAFVKRMMGLRSPALQRILAPLFRRLVFRAYRVTPERARRSEERVRSIFAKLDSTIENERYLVGGRFTLADLTLASLAAPLLAPPEHPITGRLRGTPPPELAAFRADLAATPTGRHVLRLYREHRNRRAARGPDRDGASGGN